MPFWDIFRHNLVVHFHNGIFNKYPRPHKWPREHLGVGRLAGMTMDTELQKHYALLLVPYLPEKCCARRAGFLMQEKSFENILCSVKDV
jgi:hypothetical protein